MTQTTRTLFRVLTAALVLTASASAQAADHQQIFVPEDWEGAYQFGYAPVIRVGDQVILSGIPAAGDGTYEEKIRRMYERAGDLLEAAGATFDDVIELTTFHADPKDTAEFRAEFLRYMPIHKEFLGDHRPAWSAVGTSALLAGGAPVEMRVIAVAGSGAGREVIRTDAEAKEKAAEPENGDDG